MKPAEEWHLDTRRLGRRVLVVDRLDSTSTLAATFAGERHNDGLVILAREQTAGRGQHGRTWSCPAGMGVLLSVLLFPPSAVQRPAILTAWAAVSVCETILALTGLQTRIKWPNDVLLHGHKVCGILIEQGRGTVAGIGLNVNQSTEHFRAAGVPGATSLAAATGRSFACAEVAQHLVRTLDEEYDRLCQGDLATLEACWKWRMGLLGRMVVAEGTDRVLTGRLLDVGWHGLELQQPDGQTVCLAPEAVRQLRQGVAAEEVRKKGCDS